MLGYWKDNGRVWSNCVKKTQKVSKMYKKEIVLVWYKDNSKMSGQKSIWENASPETSTQFYLKWKYCRRVKHQKTSNVCKESNLLGRR